MVPSFVQRVLVMDAFLLKLHGLTVATPHHTISRAFVCVCVSMCVYSKLDVHFSFAPNLTNTTFARLHVNVIINRFFYCV